IAERAGFAHLVPLAIVADVDVTLADVAIAVAIGGAIRVLVTTSAGRSTARHALLPAGGVTADRHRRADEPFGALRVDLAREVLRARVHADQRLRITGETGLAASVLVTGDRIVVVEGAVVADVTLLRAAAVGRTIEVVVAVAVRVAGVRVLAALHADGEVLWVIGISCIEASGTSRTLDVVRGAFGQAEGAT